MSAHAVEIAPLKWVSHGFRGSGEIVAETVFGELSVRRTMDPACRFDDGKPRWLNEWEWEGPEDFDYGKHYETKRDAKAAAVAWYLARLAPALRVRQMPEVSR